MSDILEIPKLEEGLTHLLGILQNQKKKNLTDNSRAIFLQLDFIKIPAVKKRIVRVALPHSLLNETSDVCLLVADLIRGRNVDHQKTIRHYQALLKKRGVTEVRQIIPSRQVRVEFDQFEAKRKLCKSFDIFLIDNKISGFLIPKLGKPFSKDRKWPIPIRIKRKNLKDEISSKLKKTSMCLDDKGPTKSIQIGHELMKPSEMAENILAVVEHIKKHFPAGIGNIRSLHINAFGTINIPIFISLTSRNKIATPKETAKEKRPLVTDELSTIGKKVTVYPHGKVVIHSSGESESSSDEEEEGNEDIQGGLKEKKMKGKANTEERESKMEGESERQKDEDSEMDEDSDSDYEKDADEFEKIYLRKQEKARRAQKRLKETSAPSSDGESEMVSSGNRKRKNSDKAEQGAEKASKISKKNNITVESKKLKRKNQDVDETTTKKKSLKKRKSNVC